MAEDEERTRKYRENLARMRREEKLERCARSVWLTYQLLAARAEDGSDERREFDRLQDHYMAIERNLMDLSREEEDRILEEYPKLVERLEREYGL
ncbi:hypothetical protein [Nocardiopsis alba]|uniref:hypothetical protein n=1 Tax=Nocardiopsis alba TaxID=53437 RepID=UPI0005A0E149|nr:hypothetical protein [Nocardiopsis alba]